MDVATCLPFLSGGSELSPEIERAERSTLGGRREEPPGSPRVVSLGVVMMRAAGRTVGACPRPIVHVGWSSWI
jgi:hypothetical protein